MQVNPYIQPNQKPLYPAAVHRPGNQCPAPSPAYTTISPLANQVGSVQQASQGVLFSPASYHSSTPPFPNVVRAPANGLGVVPLPQQISVQLPPPPVTHHYHHVQASPPTHVQASPPTHVQSPAPYVLNKQGPLFEATARRV